MVNNQGDAGSQQFIAGTPVYDAMGEQIGTLSTYNAQEQMLVVDKGPFRTENVYVPLTAVQRSEVDAIYLADEKDDLSNNAQPDRP